MREVKHIVDMVAHLRDVIIGIEGQLPTLDYHTAQAARVDMKEYLRQIEMLKWVLGIKSDIETPAPLRDSFIELPEAKVSIDGKQRRYIVIDVHPLYSILRFYSPDDRKVTIVLEPTPIEEKAISDVALTM